MQDWPGLDRASSGEGASRAARFLVKTDRRNGFETLTVRQTVMQGGTSMDRWIFRSYGNMALLAALLPCLIFLVACGGGGGGGDGSKKATITGTVSGTQVTVFDQNNVLATSIKASGSPKMFSLSLPAGTYRIYLIENEGTNNQRVFPLYATDALATNRFQLPSKANINLGFVSTLSGNGIPANNPLDSGATSAGADESIPPSLHASAAFTSDVQGTWYVFGLTTQSDKPGWFYGLQTFKSDGTLMAGSTWDSTGAQAGAPAGMSLLVDPSGVVRSTDPGISEQNRFNGILDQTKEIIPGATNFTTADGNSPGLIVGPALLALTKQSAFVVSDLAGLWTSFALVLGSSETDTGWVWGDLEIGTDGLAIFPLNAHSTAGISSMAAEKFAVSSLYGHIWLTEPIGPSFHGALSFNKNMVFGVSELSNYGGLTGHALRVLVRKAADCTLADLSGAWRIYALGLGLGDSPTPQSRWTRSMTTIDSNGHMTAGPGIFSDGATPANGPGTPLGTASITSDGILSLGAHDTFHGAMSSNKTFVVGTLTGQNGEHSLTIWVK